jgi:hypothetical protein
MREESPPPRLCPHCGEALRLQVKLFDPKREQRMRVFRCRSDHIIWDDEPPPAREDVSDH